MPNQKVNKLGSGVVYSVGVTVEYPHLNLNWYPNLSGHCGCFSWLVLPLVNLALCTVALTLLSALYSSGCVRTLSRSSSDTVDSEDVDSVSLGILPEL